MVRRTAPTPSPSRAGGGPPRPRPPPRAPAAHPRRAATADRWVWPAAPVQPSMSSVTCQISISLDGYAAGPHQSLDNPIGEGGMRLHQWALNSDSWRQQHGQSGGERGPDSEVVEEVTRNVGAYIMGRNMFSPGRGGWPPGWRGGGGEAPPYHTPVYVLTHHARE